MALKTDYKDYLPPETGRKFKITDAGSGLSAIEDATAYLQQGDTFGAEDINATNRQVNALCAGYSAAETAMPYTWVDGKTVYRQCLELAVSDFDQSTTEQYYPDWDGANVKTSTTQLNSKTALLNGAALILPTSCATSLASDGQSIRPISNVRPGGIGFEIGVRYDKSGTGWKISVDIGRFLVSQFSKFLFVIYYTK